jgi:F0F1-type ATP synthase membrane subunit c/vacuolar-type H+-ATPase subunit K
MPLGGGITAGTVALISSIVGAGAATAGAIGSTKNAKLRREYEQNLAVLNQQEKDALEKKLQETKTTEERHKILADTLSNITMTRLNAIEQQKLENKKTFNKLLVIGGISVAILIIGLIIVKVKKSK